MPELSHAKHVGLSHAEDGADLVLTVLPPVAKDVNALAVGTPRTYTVAAADNGGLFWAYDAYEYVIEVPTTLDDGFQALVMGMTTAGVTIDYTGYTVVGSHFPASEVTFTNEPFAVSFMVRLIGATPTIFLHGGTAKLDTVTTVYDAGWVADRPYATTVLAIGGTAAPGWLTSADVWFEDVS